jgi:hypothetical protein
MNITSKTTRAQMAAHIAEQDSFIDALKVTRAELRGTILRNYTKAKRLYWIAFALGTNVGALLVPVVVAIA